MQPKFIKEPNTSAKKLKYLNEIDEMIRISVDILTILVDYKMSIVFQ